MKKNNTNTTKQREILKSTKYALEKRQSDLQKIDAEIKQIDINLGNPQDKITTQILTEKRATLVKVRNRLEKRNEELTTNTTAQLQDAARTTSVSTTPVGPIFTFPSHLASGALPDSGALPASLSTPAINATNTVSTEPNSEQTTPLASSPSVPNTSSPSLASSISGFLASKSKSPVAIPKLGLAFKVTTFAPPAEVITTQTNVQNDRQFERSNDQSALETLKSHYEEHNAENLDHMLENLNRILDRKTKHS